MTKRKEFKSMIACILSVSESEIALIDPEYNVNWLTENTDRLKGILFDLGLDTNLQFELQEVTQHRNRLNKVVTCRRFTGTERSDPEWLTSGYASREAIDRSKNSPICDDLYRQRGLTIDAQMALENRDKYVVETEDDLEYI